MSIGKLLVSASCMAAGLIQLGCIECESTADCSPGEMCLDGQCSTTSDTDSVDTSTWDTGSTMEMTEEQCLDSVDNDGDGLTDCADPGCESYDFCIEDGGSSVDVDTDIDTDTYLEGSDYWEDGYCPNSIEIPASEDCRGVDWVGCCDVKGNAIWCDYYDVKLKCFLCGPNPETVCSWFTTDAYYTCVSNENYEGEDPSGKYPMNCSEIPDAGM